MEDPIQLGNSVFQVLLSFTVACALHPVRIRAIKSGTKPYKGSFLSESVLP